jgi:ABC-2 type transport system permease protein
VALFIVAPILILWLFSVILGTPSYNPKIAAVGLPDTLVEALEEQDARVTVYAADDPNGATAALLADNKIDAIVEFDGSGLKVTVEGTNSSATQATIKVLQVAVGNMDTAEPNERATMSINYLHGSADWSLFDFIGPLFIGIFIFVFVFITSGMSLVTERTGGTMERLLVTPIKSSELVAGYAMGFGSVALVQSFIVLFACIKLIGFPNEGSIFLVVFVTFSMALVSLTLGLLVSTLARTAFQVIQFMIVLVVPQIFFSGIFDLSQAPEWMRVLSACFPITHGASAMRGVMLRGDGFAEIWLNIVVLWGFILIFFAISTLSFNRRRSR